MTRQTSDTKRKDQQPMMKYGSVCSGIEAATVAWHPLGWRPVFFAEIDAFPSTVLAQRWPGVPNLGDFTTIGNDAGPIDLLVGGTPCQSFSIAGLRGGLDDGRGNLALEFLRLADRLGSRWVVWENVPGVLSSNGGRDFGSILGGLAELGYGWSYRVLDAQYFGVPQRRRRVFVVGHLGDWRAAAAVLFERHSLSGHPAPRRETGQRTAPCLETSSHDWSRSEVDPDLWVSPPLRSGGPGAARVGDSRGQDPIVPHAFNWQSGGDCRGLDLSDVPMVAASLRTNRPGERGDAGIHEKAQTFVLKTTPRRLTPRECERLQGFPDDYTLITYRGKPAADGPRYKALGNSMAVPVMRWIGERIEAVETLTQTIARAA